MSPWKVLATMAAPVVPDPTFSALYNDATKWTHEVAGVKPDNYVYDTYDLSFLVAASTFGRWCRDFVKQPNNPFLLRNVGLSSTRKPQEDYKDVEWAFYSAQFGTVFRMVGQGRKTVHNNTSVPYNVHQIQRDLHMCMWSGIYNIATGKCHIFRYQISPNICGVRCWSSHSRTSSRSEGMLLLCSITSCLSSSPIFKDQKHLPAVVTHAWIMMWT